MLLPLLLSIQNLVDAASPNSTVQVPTSSYSEHVVVNKPLTIDCQGSTVTGSFTVTPAANPAKITRCIMIGTDRPVFGWPLVGTGAPYVSNLTLLDNEVRKLPSSSFAVGTASGNFPNNILIDNIRFTDTSGRLINALSLFGKTNEVRNSYFVGFSGHIILSSSAGPIHFHHNKVDPITCMLLTDGDGCIQVYNSTYEIDHNLFNGANGGDSTMRAVIIARHNPTSTKNTTVSIHHNTFIANTNAPGPFNSAIEVTNAIASGDFRDNIFVGPFGQLTELRSGIFRYRSTASPGNHHNLYFGAIRNFGSEGGSPAATDLVNVDPRLDPTTFVPLLGSPVCGKASDGGAMGAFPCSGVNPSPTPTPSPSPSVSPSPIVSPTPTPSPSPSPTTQIHFLCTVTLTTPPIMICPNVP